MRIEAIVILVIGSECIFTHAQMQIICTTSPLGVLKIFNSKTSALLEDQQQQYRVAISD